MRVSVAGAKELAWLLLWPRQSAVSVQKSCVLWFDLKFSSFCFQLIEHPSWSIFSPTTLSLLPWWRPWSWTLASSWPTSRAPLVATTITTTTVKSHYQRTSQNSQKVGCLFLLESDLQVSKKSISYGKDNYCKLGSLYNTMCKRETLREYTTVQNKNEFLNQVRGGAF